MQIRQTKNFQLVRLLISAKQKISARQGLAEIS